MTAPRTDSQDSQTVTAVVAAAARAAADRGGRSARTSSMRVRMPPIAFLIVTCVFSGASFASDSPVGSSMLTLSRSA